MIMIEALILILLFTVLLIVRKPRKLGKISHTDAMLGRSTYSTTNTTRLKVITVLILVGASVLFLIPKINLLQIYDYTKLTADSWDHLLVTSTWSEINGFQTSYYSFYSKFPVAYSSQIAMHEITGLSLF